MDDEPTPTLEYLRQRADALRSLLEQSLDQTSAYARQLADAIDYLEERAAEIEAAVADPKDSGSSMANRRRA